MPLPQELTFPLGNAQSTVKIKGASANLWLGKDPGNTPLQICLLESALPLADGKLKELWSERHGGRAAPVIIGVCTGDKVTLVGPILHGDDLPVAANLEADQAGRLLKLAKECPDRHSAVRFLGSAMKTTKDETPGLENSGLFADHVLRQVMSADQENPYRKEAKAAHEKAKPLLSKSGKELIKGLGYATKANDARTEILLDADQREVALAVLLHESERPDAASPALNGQSPISHAMTQAEKRNLRWVITVAEDRSIRLYPAVLNVGVGRRGPCETFVQLHTGLLKESDAGLLWLLFSADALIQGKGAVYRLLGDSARFSGNLAEDLRERIYGEVMPRLAKAIADARRHPKKDAAYLQDTLQMATHALFRLLFIAYAEDKDLLPFRVSPTYQRESLKTLANDVLEDSRKSVKWGDTTRYWDHFAMLSQAISKGNKSLGVPAYNGVLFSDDADDSEHGHALSKVRLKDSVFAPVLAGLLLTHAEGSGLGPVDFRSLGVREFGTIYEGLLESELSEATENLILKSKDGDQIYIEAGRNEEPTVKEGEFYLHNKSGARKASGAYFTKEFAVDHLLDLALDKGLDAHLSKLDGMSENDAAETLFDFRIADIAMGSGHFLIFAIDRIERKFRSYLEKRPLPAVRLQLQELREAANKELGDMAVSVENKLEDAALLRRLIARRCIYGVDMNPISVQLAQLAVWIHTFVPGLPLSFLEHNLIQGNSLVGVANQRDFEELLDDARLSVKGYLDAALPDIRKMGAIADKNVADVKEMKKLRTAALKKLEPAFAAMDIAVWNRASGKVAGKDADDIMGLLQEPEKLLRSNALRDARKGLAPIGSRHLIACFPEVFLRKNEGFDVLLGNPPWEKVHFEEPQFWTKYISGYYALSQNERAAAESNARRSIPDADELLKKERADSEFRSLAYGNLYSDLKGYPERYGKSSGHPDLFRMFAWRFWELLRENGRVGIVLPRSAFSGDGLVEWRTQLLGAARGTEENAAEVSITSVVNTGGWVFNDIHQQYTVSLCAIHKNRAKNELLLNGPFNSIEDFNKTRLKYARFPAAEVLTWSDSAKLPLLPSSKAQDAFRQIRKAPNLVGEYDLNAQWHCQPFQELNATNHKPLFDLSGTKPDGKQMPVYKGESFDLWEPDRGQDRYYGWTKSSEETIDELYRKRKASFRRGANSPWWGAEDSLIHDKTTIECLYPRIAFRDITNRTNTRTIIAALLPPEVVCVHNAPVLVFPKGSHSDVAYVLGILSSRICDWYSRRWVEVHLTFSVFNCLPCPRVPSTHPLYKELVAAAGRLASPDKRYAKWAKSVGVDCGTLKPEEKQTLIDRVDAACALLYGLNEAELKTVFETFHEGWDWEPSHARVLAEYTALKKKHKL
jgi:hypothetical protein